MHLMSTMMKRFLISINSNSLNNTPFVKFRVAYLHFVKRRSSGNKIKWKDAIVRTWWRWKYSKNMISKMSKTRINWWDKRIRICGTQWSWGSCTAFMTWLLFRSNSSRIKYSLSTSMIHHLRRMFSMFKSRELTTSWMVA